MTEKIDIGKTNHALSCKFSMTCMEDFDASLCCDIIQERSHDLIVSPVSTFKSSNCSYLETVISDGQEMTICYCPVRIEIFRKYGK